MRKEWHKMRLGEVCEIIKGRKPALKSTPTDGDLPYLVARVMRGREEAEYASISDRNSVIVTESETIIICDGSNSGEVFTGFHGVLSSTMGKLAKKGELNDAYLRAFLGYAFETFNGAKTGAAIPHLDKEAMYALEFPCPPLSEQRRIVGILDKAFVGLATAKGNAEKNLQNARAIFDAQVSSIFIKRGTGWTEQLLNEVCIVERGSSPRPIKRYFTAEPSGVNWIKIGDTEEGGKYVYSTAQKITPEGAKQSRFVKNGDFILTNSMSFGRPYIMKTDGYIHDGWFVFRLNATIDTDYFYYLLSSSFVQAQFVRLASGSVVKNISGDLVKQTVLPIPPLQQQQVIVKKLTELEAETQRLESLYQQKLAALEALKKSLLHQAFTGTL